MSNSLKGKPAIVLVVVDDTRWFLRTVVASLGHANTHSGAAHIQPFAASDRTITSQPPESFASRTVSIASGRGFRHFQKEMNERRKSQVPSPEPNSAA
jgi:hypothetical protein